MEKANRTKNTNLVFVGGVVVGARFSIRRVCVMLCALLHRRIFFGVRRRRAGETVAAATEQDGAGEKSDGEEGTEGGEGRTFHGDVDWLA